jgi:hypothetical protein
VLGFDAGVGADDYPDPTLNGGEETPILSTGGVGTAEVNVDVTSREIVVTLNVQHADRNDSGAHSYRAKGVGGRWSSISSIAADAQAISCRSALKGSSAHGRPSEPHLDDAIRRL